MKNSLSLLLILLVYNARSQLLTGIVSIQNKKDTPAAPFTVRSADGGATDAVVLTPDGNFKLIFDEKGPGDAVQLEVLKPGYEVVNKPMLQLRLPENPEEQTKLKIYICPQGEWQHNVDSFFQINSRQIVANQKRKLLQLQDRLNKAQINAETYRREEEELRRQNNLLIEEAGRLALLFATANLDDESPRFRRAADYFARGLIDSVLIALPEEDLLRDLEFARQQIRDGETLQKIAAQNNLQALHARDSIGILGGLLEALQRRFTLDSVTLHIAGYIVDGDTGRPIEQAVLQIGNWQGRSDQSGYFETLLVQARELETGKISVRAAGYEPLENSFTRLQAGKLKLYLYKTE